MEPEPTPERSPPPSEPPSGRATGSLAEAQGSASANEAADALAAPPRAARTAPGAFAPSEDALEGAPASDKGKGAASRPLAFAHFGGEALAAPGALATGFAEGRPPATGTGFRPERLPSAQPLPAWPPAPRPAPPLPLRGARAPRSLRWTVALVLWVALIPWSWRALLLFERGATLGLGDLRGACVDLGVSLVLVLLGGWRTLLLAPLLVAWCLLNFLSQEVVRALDALPNLAQRAMLDDPTFVRGSVLAMRHQLLFALGCLASPLGAAALLRQGRPQPVALGVGALLFGLLLWAWPAEPSRPLWRQTHVIPDQLSQLLSPAPPAPPTGPEVERVLDAAFGSDLSGLPTRTRAQGAPRPNVLIVILEGLCGGYVERNASHQKLKGKVELPYLNELAGSALCYPNFVTHQAQTNRGEYALLTGRYPKLRTETAKMTEVSGGVRPAPHSLPRALAAAGYRSLYLQPAPLTFMQKDRFMARIGFDEVEGGSSLPRSYARNGWGVDDRAYLEQSLERAQELERMRQRDGAPWLLTLMSVGTHHPYLVPESYTELPDASPFERSLRYLDDALREFFANLEESGLLRNTLVIVTSDESAGLKGARQLESGAPVDSQLTQLSRNWGLLVIRTPEGHAALEPAPCAQTDLPLSVCDYLGVPPGDLPGRSLFRRYETPRPIFFSNVYLRRCAVFSPQSSLLITDEGLRPLFHTRFASERLFAPFGGPASDQGPLGLLAGAVARTCGDPAAPAVYTLCEPGPFLVSPGRECAVFDGQYFDLPTGAELELEIEAELEGSGGEFGVRLVTNGGLTKQHEERHVYAEGKQPLRVRLEHTLKGAHRRLNVSLLLKPQDQRTRIRVSKATLRITPLTD